MTPTNSTMPSNESAFSATSAIDTEDSWASLLERLKVRAVVPILGPELLDVKITAGDGAVKSGPFYRLVGEALCSQYGVDLPSKEDGRAWDLHAAVASVIAQRKENIEKVRRSTARLVSSLGTGATLIPSVALLKNVEAFDLIVSLTCDDLLTDALAPAHVVNFSPRASTGTVIDIPVPRAGERVLFRAFGAASDVTNFAIHEEDILEYLFTLQTEGSRRLPNTLSELRRRDLLFIGCTLPDWLGRPLLRLFSDDRLSAKSKQEFFSDSGADPAFTSFFSRFSPNTMIFQGNLAAFIEELVNRWTAIAPQPSSRAPEHSHPAQTPRSPGPTAFISYASENRKAARSVADTLMTVGFSDVWLDQKKLIAGDDWSRRIDDAVNACDFFFPLLSREADSRREGVYWEEWDKALTRSRRIPDEFIIPVGVDGDSPSKTIYPRISG
ncbi:MAG: toll/interleukin-1 receptor domain-containing protein, partial [Deltaproteobacteria bacterium]|nr:toll/interleukin-1 receptor domain-containing protein [Deltaproteobacteria bacterium]